MTMSEEIFNSELRRWIKRLEGTRDMPYWDDDGKPVIVKRDHACMTIGVGHNLASPMPKELIDLIFQFDFGRVQVELAKTNAFKYSYAWPEPVLAVIIDMAFNCGIPRLLGFKRMIKYLNQGRWDPH